MKRALVCAPKLPEFDREGGSRRIFHLIEYLQQAGWAVSFVAEYAEGGERYAHVLQQRGIPVYALYETWAGGRNALTDIEFLAHSGAFDLALFAFWYCAENYIPSIRAVSPSTTVVVDSVDVHFLRESRGVFRGFHQNGDLRALSADFGGQMTRELNVYAASDAVLTVSRKEAELIDDFLGKPSAHDVPDTEDIAPSMVPFERRKGMLFVGNFRHPPNVEAVEYLFRDILPQVPAAILDEHPIYIVGNEPSEAVRRCCKDSRNARLVGWVPSVVPYLERVRLSVIPLLYGAGTKRKLMQSLMAGTPSVSTPVGIEGFDLDNRHVLVAGDAAGFAAHIVRLMTDKELWTRVAHDGGAYIRTTHSREAVFSRFMGVLETIMSANGSASHHPQIQPARSHSVFVEELRPGHPSDFDSNADQAAREEAIQKGGLHGFCNVAAVETEFRVSSDNFREGVVAAASSSINRHRQLICALSMAVFGRPDAPLRQITAYANQNNLRTYIAEANSVLAAYLKSYLKPNLLVRSEYFGPQHRSGELVDGVFHEDLQQTSFANDAFDIVITCDVFEHVPNAIAAEQEVMRILRPGGTYCFTVPFFPASDHDLVLADVDESGTARHFAPPQYHEDPLRPEEGALVFRLFSFNDMKSRFEAMGCQFTSYRFWSRALGILGADCWAHVARKRR
jgi:SAM-dependent methyltransferase/glycosyltransferase involved in cell wall biosynthesis